MLGFLSCRVLTLALRACVTVCVALGDQAATAAAAGTSGSNICAYENANCIAWQSPIRRLVASFASVSASAKCVTAVT